MPEVSPRISHRCLERRTLTAEACAGTRGVFLLEAMGQAGSVLIAETGAYRKGTPVFTLWDRVHLRRTPQPLLEPVSVETELVQRARMNCKARDAAGNVLATARLSFHMADWLD